MLTVRLALAAVLLLPSFSAAYYSDDSDSNSNSKPVGGSPYISGKLVLSFSILPLPQYACSAARFYNSVIMFD